MPKKICFSLLAALAVAGSAPAQSPVITSFGQNGVLVSSNLLPGSVVGVEWAPAVTGPWQSDWSSLTGIIAPTNQEVTVSVPMFYRVRGLTNGGFTSDGMAFIPAGSFIIGDSTDGDLLSDARPTNVHVSSFYMDTNLVSGGLWTTVTNYAFAQGHVFTPGTSSGFTRSPGHPVELLRWLDAVNWCNARSRLAGLTPVYYGNAELTQVYTNAVLQTNGLFPDWTASGYRLPTEAEWEKAARGGRSGQRFPWGNTITWSNASYSSGYNILGAGTWSNYLIYDVEPGVGSNPAWGTGTTPAGAYPPNGYGLFDMAGNVFQRCWDWYALPPYPAGSAYLGGHDPRGPAAGTERVSRGGTWNTLASAVRSARRSSGAPDVLYSQQGFRCVRQP